MAYLDPQKTQKDPSASTIERTLSPPAHANCNFPAANARPFIPFSDLCHEAERESFRGDPLREVSTAQACFVELSLAPIPLSTHPTTPGMLMAYLSLAHSTICWKISFDAARSDRHAVLR